MSGKLWLEWERCWTLDMIQRSLRGFSSEYGHHKTSVTTTRVLAEFSRCIPLPWKPSRKQREAADRTVNLTHNILCHIIYLHQYSFLAALWNMPKFLYLITGWPPSRKVRKNLEKSGIEKFQRNPSQVGEIFDSKTYNFWIFEEILNFLSLSKTCAIAQSGIPDLIIRISLNVGEIIYNTFRYLSDIL